MNKSHISLPIKPICAALCMSLIAAVGSTGETEDEATHEEEERGKNTLGLFLGATHEHDDYLRTLGIEYSYRLHPRWSVGGVIERAEREKDSTLVIAFLHFFPIEGLFLGPGFGRKDPGDERENTIRLSIGYEIELGRGWELVPNANVDFIENEEDEEVFGIVIAKRF